MAKLKQSISYKYATNKKKKAKYKAVSSKHIVKKSNDNTSTTKFAYTKKITLNGKTRYYYA